jgi:hypothetical protein
LIFRGNKGFDRVGRPAHLYGLWAGEFNGGPGTDRANICNGGSGTTIQVETKTFTVCP